MPHFPCAKNRDLLGYSDARVIEQLVQIVHAGHVEPRERDDEVRLCRPAASAGLRGSTDATRTPEDVRIACNRASARGNGTRSPATPM